jgi:hypothetical protein
MWANMFSRARGNSRQDEKLNHNLLSDCVRLIRDCFAVADDLFKLRVLAKIVEAFDYLLNDEKPCEQPKLG